MMPRTITLTTAALCCFAFCSVSLGAQPEAGEVVCPKAVSTISIDGKADEAAWKQAATVGPFVTIATLGKPGGSPTHARLLHDDSALYL